MTRKSTASTKGGTKIDRRRFNKGNPQNLRPWPKGVSGNPRGRRVEKGHDALSDFIRALANDTLGDGEMTRLEAMVRSMFVSKSAVDHIALLEHGWGKVTLPITINDELLAWLRENAEALRADPAERARVLRVLAEGGHDAAALFASVGLEAMVAEAEDV